MYFCRVHGEPLVREESSAWWKCPEFNVCKTYITDEYIFMRYLDRLFTTALFDLRTEHAYEFLYNKAQDW